MMVKGHADIDSAIAAPGVMRLPLSHPCHSHSSLTRPVLAQKHMLLLFTKH